MADDEVRGVATPPTRKKPARAAVSDRYIDQSCRTTRSEVKVPRSHRHSERQWNRSIVLAETSFRLAVEASQELLPGRVLTPQEVLYQALLSVSGASCQNYASPEVPQSSHLSAPRQDRPHRAVRDRAPQSPSLGVGASVSDPTGNKCPVESSAPVEGSVPNQPLGIGEEKSLKDTPRKGNRLSGATRRKLRKLRLAVAEVVAGEEERVSMSPSSGVYPVLFAESERPVVHPVVGVRRAYHHLPHLDRYYSLPGSPLTTLSPKGDSSRVPRPYNMQGWGTGGGVFQKAAGLVVVGQCPITVQDPSGG
uniref:Uncharacterized protein n=1 Tax=Schizaphis graminum TaxID=13262 RepID=A0A2S2PDU8_SCHGA